jgi:nitrogen regulatory protein PII
MKIVMAIIKPFKLDDFVLALEHAVRIRTGETDSAAL